MRTPPPEAWLRKMLWSVLGALRVLHEGNTLHRDISPDNIFLQDNGPPVLLDLGAARHAINDQGHQHTVVLKVNYAPIEQYSEGDDELRQGPWSDLYSLAAVVHGCLCNDTPLPATLRSIRDRMVPFARVAKTVQRQFGVQYSAPFVAAIAQALALRPEDRPRSIDAFLQTMGMTSPPEGVEHFDFRAELGGIWVESADRPGPGGTAPIVDAVSAPPQMADLEDLTYRSARPELPPAGLGARDNPAAAGPDTVAAGMADTVFIDVGDSVFEDSPRMGTVPAEPPSRAERSEQKQKRTRKAPGSGAQRTGHAAAGTRSRWPSSSVWLAGILLTLGAAAGASWWTQGHSTPPRPAGDMLTELKEPLAVPANSISDIPLAGEGDQSAAAVAGGPGGVPAAPAAAEAAVAGPAVRMPAQRRALPGPSSTTAVVVQDISAPEPVVGPRPRAPVARAMGPEEACADAGMLARPLCIFNECKKPGLATHPVCVDVRRRQEADEQRRQMQN